MTGIGPDAAQRMLRWLESNHPNPPFVVMAGYAGALREGFQVGEVIVAKEILDPDNGRWTTSWPVHPKKELRSVRLLTTRTMIGDPEEKRRLGDKHDADAVDMEAAAVARFCSERNIPFGCVRALSDDVRTRLSPALVRLLAGGQVSVLRVLAELLRRPTLLSELLRLGRHTRIASHALADALRSLLASQ